MTQPPKKKTARRRRIDASLAAVESQRQFEREKQPQPASGRNPKEK